MAHLYCQVSGQGPALLLLHGLGSSSRDWELQVPSFSEHFTVLAPDLRGHGNSPAAGSVNSIPLMATDVAGLLDSNGFSKAAIIGLSMGGMVAMQLALDQPGLVDRLVLVNCSAEVPLDTIRKRIQYWQRRLALSLFGMRGVGILLAPRLFPHPHQADLRRTFKQRWRLNNRQNYRKAMDAVVSWSAVERLWEIRCPTLVVSAEHDYLPLALKVALANGIPGARLALVSGSHHGLSVEYPRVFNRLALDFLVGP